MKIKVLNLYAGIGGNRKLWQNVEVTAVEINPDIAAIYQGFFPNDKVIVSNAHQYLLEHYNEFDFIWSSPPCPTHSRFRTLLNSAPDKYKVKYPDMNLYQEIIFLDSIHKGKWVVENVISYYNPLIKPFESGNHYFWSNFIISNKKMPTRLIRRNHNNVIKRIKDWGFNLDFNNVDSKQKEFLQQIINNCTEPKLGLHIFNCAYKEKQEVLI